VLPDCPGAPWQPRSAARPQQARSAAAESALSVLTVDFGTEPAVTSARTTLNYARSTSRADLADADCAWAEALVRSVIAAAMSASRVVCEAWALRSLIVLL
jgi:hypothetical protein